MTSITKDNIKVSAGTNYSGGRIMSGEVIIYLGSENVKGWGNRKSPEYNGEELYQNFLSEGEQVKQKILKCLKDSKKLDKIKEMMKDLKYYSDKNDKGTSIIPGMINQIVKELEE